MSIFDWFRKKKTVCPKCGHMNDMSARYCVKCGNVLVTVSPVPIAPVSTGAVPAAPVSTTPMPNAPVYSAPAPAAPAPMPSAPPAPSVYMPSQTGGFASHREDVPKAVFVPNAEAGVQGDEYTAEDFEGETTVLGVWDNDDETTILGEVYMPPAYLIREDTGEHIIITAPQFLLGRDREGVHYCIDGRTVVSRKHAAIILEQGRYLMVDMESSNKTYVDDMELVPGQGAELFSGSRIRLADVEFTFYLD